MLSRTVSVVVALSLAVLLSSQGCSDSSSPTEPAPAPTPVPTAAPEPTPAPGCAQIAGSYFRAIADSTCLGLRQGGGPLVREVSPCVFETDDAYLQARVTLVAQGHTGTVTLVWFSCSGSATGRFEYADGNVTATFTGSATGSWEGCCGPTSGSFQWLYRR